MTAPRSTINPMRPGPGRRSNMKTMFFCKLMAAFAVFVTFKITAAEPIETKHPSPALGIEEALTIAKAYVQEHHLKAGTDSYIDSVKLERQPADKDGKFWLVTWLPNRYATGLPIKGGQLYVRVYLDKSVKASHGE